MLIKAANNVKFSYSITKSVSPKMRSQKNPENVLNNIANIQKSPFSS